MRKRRLVATILFGLMALSACAACGALTYLMISGAWQALLSTVSSIIAGGTPAIVSAILALIGSYVFLVYCLIPIIALIIFFGLVFFTYSQF